MKVFILFSVLLIVLTQFQQFEGKRMINRFSKIRNLSVISNTYFGLVSDLKLEIYCVTICSADERCFAANFHLNTKLCELYSATESIKIDDSGCLGSDAISQLVNPNTCDDGGSNSSSSEKAIVVETDNNVNLFVKFGVKVYDNRLQWGNIGECYEGRSHHYNGTYHKGVYGPELLLCQGWNDDYPNAVTMKPLNSEDHTTNFCRATEIDGEILCYSSPRYNLRQVTVIKCPVCPCSTCNKLLDLPRTPENSKPGALSTRFSQHVTFECKSRGPSQPVDHCPVSTCIGNNWSTDYSVSCSYADCYTLSYEYKGKMSCTVSGIPCQKWNTNNPHTVHKMPRDSEDWNTNYCRDDPNERVYVPWCYTIDPNVRFELCPVPKCLPCDARHMLPEVTNTKRRMVAYYTRATYECKSLKPGAAVDHCPVSVCLDGKWTNYSTSCSTEDCYTTFDSYKGKVSCTESGIVCQKWSTHSPHFVNYFPSDPEAVDSNYCRSLDKSEKPWCYTSDSKVRWEFCPVQSCHSYS